MKLKARRICFFAYVFFVVSALILYTILLHGMADHLLRDSHLRQNELTNGTDASSTACQLADLDLLLPLHHKDAPLASSLFFSLERSMPCYHELIVVVPPESEFSVSAAVPSYAKVVVVPDSLPKEFGYLSQQLVKVYADQFTSAPRVLILEADLILSRWDDECFFGVDESGRYNGKMKVYCVDFEAGNSSSVWKLGTDHAIGKAIEPRGIKMDCCVNSPFAYTRDVFPALRKHIRTTHNKSIGKVMEDYFPGHSKGWEVTDLLFSEFNILNHFLLQNFPQKVELVMPSDIQWSRNRCSRHIGAEVERNYDLRNPKLTLQYFELAYHAASDDVASSQENATRSEIVLT